MFSGKEDDFHVWAKNVENQVSGVWSFAVESQAVVIAGAVALGVLPPDDEASAETDGQLFTVLSALTDGETF